MFFQVYLFSLFWLEIKLSVCCWLNLCTVIFSTGDPRFKGYFFFRIYTRLKPISHLDSICCTLLRTCNLYKGNFDLVNIFEITDYITALKFELECAVFGWERWSKFQTCVRWYNREKLEDQGLKQFDLIPINNFVQDLGEFFPLVP